MMMSNFSHLVESLGGLKETEIMLSKYIKIIENSNNVSPNNENYHNSNMYSSNKPRNSY